MFNSYYIIFVDVNVMLINNIIQLLTGDEGNIWYVGPEDKMLPKAEGNNLSSGPTYHMLPESPVNNCFVKPSLV